MKPAARGRRVAIRRAGPLDLALLARLHAACFEEAWDSAALASLLAMPGACALIAGAGRGEALGFVILRAVAGEAEIISLGVEPRARRLGVGRRLLAGALAAAAASDAARIFLEVAADNWAARALYLEQGFLEVGRRPGYYRRPHGSMAALVLAKTIGRK